MASPFMSCRILNSILSRNCRSCQAISWYSASSHAQQNVKRSQNEDLEKEEEEKQNFYKLAEYRFTFPEFLPDPRFDHRHKLKEKLERQDMLRRRSVIDIPEFYVGSILAVTASDPFAPGKENRFVGICIARTYIGTKAGFTLRNVVDMQGVEIMYDLYNPTIQRIQVLRLEKRLDNELLYLRDAPLEYSTFPFDMEPEFIAEGEPVRVNPLKVKLKPRPWTRRWQVVQLKGVEPFDDQIKEVEKKRALKITAAWAWDKYDMMKQYRGSVPMEDQKEIWEEVDEHRKLFQQNKQKWKQRVLLKAPTLKKGYEHQ